MGIAGVPDDYPDVELLVSRPQARALPFSKNRDRPATSGELASVKAVEFGLGSPSTHESRSMSAQEKIIWEGNPSQITNLGVYLLCGLLFFLVVPIFYAIWRWIETRCHRFTISDQRIRIATGVLNKQVESIELYRIKDVVLLQPLSLRMFGLGHVELRTSDLGTPLLTIPTVPEGNALRDERFIAAEARRGDKGMRQQRAGER